jgi:hypothetical protein
MGVNEGYPDLGRKPKTPNGGYRQRDSVEHEEHDGALILEKGYLKTTPSTTNQKENGDA